LSRFGSSGQAERCQKCIKVPKDPTGGSAKDAGQVNAAKYSWIMSVIRKAKSKAIVIDDSQYLLVNELFDRTYEKGYDKFTSIALNFRNLIHWVNIGLPEDVTVYFLHHTQLDDFGNIKAKTIGKMLDEKLTVEGCFDVVLMTERNQDGWWFRTATTGNDPVKAPMEMFSDELIPNDLAVVDKAIREYYGLEEEKT
jgi:hypothetical protein